jgi:type IX secretion system substrate protein
MKKIALLFIVITINLSAQMQKFPLLELINNAIPESFMIEGDENELLMFWIDSTDLHMSKSLDDATTWNSPTTLADNTIISDSLSDLNALKLNSGRILVTYKQIYHHSIYSDDNGLTWSDPVELITELGTNRRSAIYESTLSQTNDNKIWFVYESSNRIYNIQSDGGITWSDKENLLVLELSGWGSVRSLAINSHWNGSLILTYIQDDNDTVSYLQSLSDDNGLTWNEPEPLFDNESELIRARIVKGSDKTLWLAYSEKLDTTLDYKQSDIFYSKLIDGSTTWTTPIKFTNYVGFDGIQNISIAKNKPYISFLSGRVSVGNTLWYGVADETIDNGPTLVMFETSIKYQNNYPKVNINITAKAYSLNEIDSVMFYYKAKDGIETPLQLFDDGLHNDIEADDFIFGNDLVGLNSNFNFDVFFSLVDVDGNRTTTKTSNIESPFEPDGGDEFVFDNNNLIFPIDSKGVLADEYYGNGAKYDDKVVIWSSGFFLSGYSNGNLWGNGVNSVYINDYVHGTIDGVESLNKIHIVRSSQLDFYQSWINWEDAVNQGADFYDGDGNGIYNPLDLNGNGTWDVNEDKPDILGDITAFTVFNDGDISNDGFNNVEPQGIEIKQTVFSYDKITSPKLSNVIFVRYRIENMGTVADKLDSVYFGAWADLDLGEPYNDLFGTDTTLNSSYCYNVGEDEDYGTNPPACFISFLQGLPVYTEGETYDDTNGNGMYDDGIDTPLSTAINRKGELLGVDEYSGSKNNGLNASVHFVKGTLTQGDPDDENQLRSYMLGQNRSGELIDPCNWEFGEVFNEDCSTINPRFIYAGDPVAQSGWVCRYPSDQRQLGSTGPFDLVKGEPIEIIIAYIVGRGTDALNSITEARRITKDVIGFYNTNFSYVPVGINDKPEIQLPTEYSLSQNYPNPFNPSTTIKYSIANVGTSRDLSLQQVVLKIYDILGREVATLVNKQQKAGSHEVQFDASNLTSGVYFYQLHASSISVPSYIESKKMILLK